MTEFSWGPVGRATPAGDASPLSDGLIGVCPECSSDGGEVTAGMRRGGGDADVTLKIPRPLYEQLKQVIQGSGFHSVTEFAVYVLRDLLSHHELPRAPSPAPSPQGEPPVGVDPLSPEEIEAIRARLTSLGYL